MNNLEIAIEQVIEENNISHQWSDAVTNELKDIRLDFFDKRKDLTKVPLVTIDGADAKDFDDAIHCTETNSSYILSVAIADVAALVCPGTALDEEAIKRGTSIYFPSKVIPMLPEKISNDLCSLVPFKDRNAVVCEMVFSFEGNLNGYNFFEAKIKSHKRMTYKEVDEVLKNNSGLEKNINFSLVALSKLTRILLNKRQERQALEIEAQEPFLKTNEFGDVEEIVLPKRMFSHQMVEESMLAANVCAANFMHKHYESGIYRIHEEPDETKLDALKNFFSLKGFKGSFKKDALGLLSQCLEYTKVQNINKSLQTVVLQSLKRAEYSTKEKGHFGLQIDRYSHFTSPIRRYPDLITHRLIKNALNKNKVSFDKEYMEEICSDLSDLERIAEKSSRQVTQQMICYYLKNYVGKEFNTIVTGVTDFGLFAEIEGFYVSGLIHVSDLPGDRYFYDRDSNILKGKRTGRSFKLGQKILVTIANTSPEERKITLIPKNTKKSR